MGKRTGSALVALLVTALVLASCGTGDDGDGQQTGQAQSAAGSGEGDNGGGDPDETGSDTPTGAAGGSDNAGVSADPGPEDGDEDEEAGAPPADDGRSRYQLDPVAADDDAQSLHDLLIDLHGPTPDVAAQVNRLTSFPGVPTPTGGAVITEVSTLQDPADPANVADLSSILASTRVSFYVAASPEELITLYEDAYRSWGYTNVKTTEESTEAAVSTTLMLELGEELGRPEAEVTISDEADTELTLVKIVQRERIDGGDRYLELARWSSPYVPNGAQLSLVQVGTSYIKLETVVSNQVQIETRWEVNGDQNQTAGIIQELAAAEGVEHEVNNTGATLLTGPAGRIDLTGNNGSIGIDIVYSLDDLVGRVEAVG